MERLAHQLRQLVKPALDANDGRRALWMLHDLRRHCRACPKRVGHRCTSLIPDRGRPTKVAARRVWTDKAGPSSLMPRSSRRATIPFAMTIAVIRSAGGRADLDAQILAPGRPS